MKDTAEPLHIPNMSGTVQANFFSECSDGLWGRGLAQNRLGNIAWQQLHDKGNDD
jgi:hypothetical protein